MMGYVFILLYVDLNPKNRKCLVFLF